MKFQAKLVRALDGPSFILGGLEAPVRGECLCKGRGKVPLCNSSRGLTGQSQADLSHSCSLASRSTGAPVWAAVSSQPEGGWEKVTEPGAASAQTWARYSGPCCHPPRSPYLSCVMAVDC